MLLLTLCTVFAICQATNAYGFTVPRQPVFYPGFPHQGHEEQNYDVQSADTIQSINNWGQEPSMLTGSQGYNGNGYQQSDYENDSRFGKYLTSGQHKPRYSPRAAYPYPQQVAEFGFSPIGGQSFNAPPLPVRKSLPQLQSPYFQGFGQGRGFHGYQKQTYPTPYGYNPGINFGKKQQPYLIGQRKPFRNNRLYQQPPLFFPNTGHMKHGFLGSQHLPIGSQPIMPFNHLQDNFGQPNFGRLQPSSGGFNQSPLAQYTNNFQLQGPQTPSPNGPRGIQAATGGYGPNAIF